MLERLGPAADLNTANLPRIDALDVVDDDGAAAAALDVAVLLRLLEPAPADADRVALGVVRPADRDDMRRAVPPDGGDASEPALAAQLSELAVAESTHAASAGGTPPRGAPAREVGPAPARLAGAEAVTENDDTVMDMHVSVMQVHDPVKLFR